MRVINFNPGPAALPQPALERARDELLDFEGSGMSIMEHSHRGKVYEAVHHEAQERLRRLLKLPDTYTIVFSTGGASMQFALVPMNFLPPGRSADYVLTGGWSEKALDEAKLVGATRVAGSTRLSDGRYVRVPTQAEVQLSPDAAYVHTTSNNTLYGTQFHTFLDTGPVPHVCDMSSDFLWRPTDLSRFALTYAGAQKNLGPSGVVVVVANRDFLRTGRKELPKILRYQTQADNDSMYNTPPTLAIYLVRNVLAWLEGEGGLEAMERRNRAKAELLYGTLDALAGFYTAPVERASRSVMNVVFRLPTEALDEQFVAEAKQAGMVGLKGHRLTGGIRVSAYNAVSERDVATLVDFMKAFAKAKG
ncbi:MAG: 3-phosphoserine/phosphohydroxythreonine transaminase [Myxococcaceae bacterium]|jgi:phosphoserine aminotransferase|nr:3-phosphoserine/phosphohydroxythreonine transaminase [Myxococcaceae bacterium]MCA3011107.1 3-phosphoserine/phosphohydroxythreonine transaminase [Myxococcaceae bacterium]